MRNLAFDIFLQRHGAWVSLLGHLILLFLFSFVWVGKIEDDRKPSLYIPSYIATQPSQPSQVEPQAQPSQNQPVTHDKPKETSKIGIEKPVSKKSTEQKATTKSSVARPPSQAVRQFQAIESSREEQGVHLIGDEKIDKSLRTILGKAISAHLFYPKSAIEFNVRGTVLVGFTLHPNGQVTNIQLVKPSNAGILNGAALSAINEISPVEGVSEYISEPRFLVVGIIFG